MTRVDSSVELVVVLRPKCANRSEQEDEGSRFLLDRTIFNACTQSNHEYRYSTTGQTHIMINENIKVFIK